MHLAASCMIDIASRLTTPIQIPFLTAVSHRPKRPNGKSCLMMYRDILELNICLYFTLRFRRYRYYLYLPILCYCI